MFIYICISNNIPFRKIALLRYAVVVPLPWSPLIILKWLGALLFCIHNQCKTCCAPFFAVVSGLQRLTSMKTLDMYTLAYKISVGESKEVAQFQKFWLKSVCSNMVQRLSMLLHRNLLYILKIVRILTVEILHGSSFSYIQVKELLGCSLISLSNLMGN